MWIGEASAFTPVFNVYLSTIKSGLAGWVRSIQTSDPCVLSAYTPVLQNYPIMSPPDPLKKLGLLKKRGLLSLSYTALSCNVRSSSFFNGQARTRALSVRNMAASSWNTAARPNERYPAAAPLSQRHLPDQTAPVHSGNPSSSSSSRNQVSGQVKPRSCSSDSWQAQPCNRHRGLLWNGAEDEEDGSVKVIIYERWKVILRRIRL